MTTHTADQKRYAADSREARMLLSYLVEPGDLTVGAMVKHSLGGSIRTIDQLLGGRGFMSWSSKRYEAAQRAKVRYDEKLLDRLRLTAERTGIRFAIPGDDEWPTSLDVLGDASPFGLWVRGASLAGVFDKSISIVGARAATSYGDYVALDIATALVEKGYTIVSGAAYGIDGAAHRAALSQNGTTVAFLAGGADRPYPAAHGDLLDRMTHRGAAISEVPPGTAPTRWRFLQRNRLIAAASQGTVVVEAGARSGSLSAARHAQSVGRPVMAVPGPITSAASAGCHLLIKQGAALVTSSEDILAHIPGAVKS